MDGQGCSDLPADINRRILDRIAGLEKIIAPELVEQPLAQTDKQTKRVCTLTNEVMMWVVLAMGLFTELPIRQVFKACRRLRRGEDSPALSLGHFVVRALMLEAATAANIEVDRLSFKGSFQILKTRLPELDPSDELSFREWFEAVLWEISRERIPARRNRINPRVIKRKMSHWNKCRPEHRKQKPLTKTFEQTVVMVH